MEIFYRNCFSNRIIKLLKSCKLRNRARQDVKNAFSDPKIPPVLVYTMGKVGSSTVAASLNNASLPNKILQVHFLSNDLSYYRKLHKNFGLYPPPYHIFLGEEIHKVLTRRRFPCIKIISLFRDPIAFTISDLFQNPHFAKEPISDDGGNILPDKAIKYLEKELRNPRVFKYLLQWFDRELKEVFDIDIFATPFPSKNGSKVYTNKNISALVMSLESLSFKGVKAISEFLNIDSAFKLEVNNMRERLSDSNAYQAVLKNITLKSDLCKKIYSSKFVKHLYCQSFIDRFIERWSYGFDSEESGRSKKEYEKRITYTNLIK